MRPKPASQSKESPGRVCWTTRRATSCATKARAGRRRCWCKERITETVPQEVSCLMWFCFTSSRGRSSRGPLSFIPRLLVPRSTALGLVPRRGGQLVHRRNTDKAQAHRATYHCGPQANQIFEALAAWGLNIFHKWPELEERHTNRSSMQQHSTNNTRPSNRGPQSPQT